MLPKAAIRRGLLFFHLWLGLAIGAYFSVIGVSGSLLVYRDSLERIQMSELAYCAPPSAGATLLPLSEILARLRTIQPAIGEEDLSEIGLPWHKGGAYRITLNSQKSINRRTVTIDPYTAKILRNQAEDRTFFGFLYALHVLLLMGGTGALVNGAGGVLAAVLLLSGICLWWPATLQQLKSRLTLQSGGSNRRWLLSVHHVLGGYSYLLLLTITLTGAIFIYPQPIQKLVATAGLKAPRRSMAEIVPTPGKQRLSIDALVAIAEQTEPTARITSLNYPTERDQPFACTKQRLTPGFSPIIRLQLNPYSGQVLRVGDDATAPTEKKIQRTLSLLHFGSWGGPLVRFLYALAGLMPLGLFATGVLAYLGRRRQ